MIRKTYSIIIIGLIFLLNSCQYDSIEDLYPENPDCDISNISFVNDVWPIINSNCTSCHSGATPSGNTNLENYNQIKSVAESGKLLNVIRHKSGWSPMPKGESKLPDCSISKIEKWIESGYPNN